MEWAGIENVSVQRARGGGAEGGSGSTGGIKKIKRPPRKRAMGARALSHQFINNGKMVPGTIVNEHRQLTTGRSTRGMRIRYCPHGT